ncbi:unnamed protein product [Brachionus calyciflorus]|uniref:Uncharacterized protein n=1 Tax=Brachionus calyciflorus TaxID=104777 RepID=A0A814MTW6_9BILA|nr:unnamed protein product [Brachionus calyciflorus]
MSSKGYKIVFEKGKCLILKNDSIIESNSRKQNNSLYELKLFFQDNKRVVQTLKYKIHFQKINQLEKKSKENKFEINKENKVNMQVKNKPKKIVKFSECTKYECFMSRNKNFLEHLERFERDGIMVRKNNSQKELQSSYKVRKRKNNNSFSSKDFQEDYSMTIHSAYDLNFKRKLVKSKTRLKQKENLRFNGP